MVQIVALGVLLQETERPPVWVLDGVNHVIWLSKIDLIVISYDLPLRLSLETHLDNVSGLVVEKPMRIS